MKRISYVCAIGTWITAIVLTIINWIYGNFDGAWHTITMMWISWGVIIILGALPEKKENKHE